MHNNRLVDLLEELVFCGVVAYLSNGCIQARRVLLNGLAKSLLLLLESVILSKMGDVLLFEFFKYSSFIGSLRMDLHELLNSVMSVDHCDSVVHDLLLREFDLVKLIKGLFDGNDCWVTCNCSGIRVLRN